MTVDYTPRPTAPQSVTAVAGNGDARVKWLAPSNASDAQISSYKVTAVSPDGGATPDQPACAPSSCPGADGFLVTGLTNGKKYTFTVTATGPGGTSPAASTPDGVTYTPTAPDSAGPAAPSITSNSHPKPGTWYSVGDLALSWTEPADPSGISGYSYALNNNATFDPPTNVTPDPRTSITYPNTPTGDYYFHVRARDGAGNWGTTSHYRLLVDLTAPAPATRPSETADLRTGHPYQGADRPLFLASNDRTITMRWDAGAADGQSGNHGFSYDFNNNSTFTPDTVRETDENQPRTATSRPLPDGVWYFHVVALDKAAGSTTPEQPNRSSVLTSGPYLIGEATLADALLSGTTAGSDELGLEQFAPYASQPLGNGTAYTHLRTGNLVTQQDLFTIPGQGLNTVARLTHNSQAAGRDSGVGAGWNLSVTDLEGGIEGPLEDLTDGAVTDIDINRDVTLAAITTEPQTATKRLTQNAIDDANAAQGKLLEFVDGDGTTHRFVREAGAGGRWISPPGVDLKVHEYLDPTTRQADRYDLVRPDGVTYTATKLAFKDKKALALPVWRITKVTDRSGNSLTYDHDNFSLEGVNKTRLIRITQNRADGDRIAAEFTYEPFSTDNALKVNAGVLRSITTLPRQTGQRRWLLEITDGNLVSGGGHDLLSITEAADATVATTSGATTPSGSTTGMSTADAQSSGRRTTSYTYSAEDRTLTSVTDPNGNRTLLRYLPGKPVGSTTSDRTVPMLESLTDRSGAVTRFAYAAAPQGGGVTRTTVTRPAGAAGEGSNVAEYDISARGPVNPNGDPRTAGGNIIKTVDAGTVSPSGALIRVITRHDWYANKLVRTRDADGAATSFRYNDLGLLLQVTHPAPNKAGAAALDGDRTPTGRISNTLAYRYAPEPRFSYPSSGTGSCTPAADTPAEDPAATESDFQPSRQVSPVGNCASVAELTRVTTAANTGSQQRLADFAYDAAGRLTDVIERSDSGAAAGSPARDTDRRTQFAYYTRGGLKQIDGPRTDVTDVTRYGQFADTTTPADPAYGGADRSGQPTKLRDADGKTKTFTYSPYGMVTAVTDRDGRTTTSRYDERDNLIAATVPGGATTTYTYDSNDNKRFEVQPARTSGSGSSAPTTETRYDAMDRQVLLLAPGADESAASPVKTTTETRYNPDGTTRSVDGPLAAGDVTTYEYYANRMPRRTLAPATGSTTADTTTFYDAVGRAVRTEGPAVDAAGNRPVETTTYTPSGEVQSTATTSTSDAGNGTAGNTDRVVDMAYNAHGEAVRTLAPALTAGGSKRGVETTTYDAFGQPTAKSRLLDAPGGDKQVVSATGFDLAGNAIRQTQATANGQQLETLYRFDALNRLAEQTKDPVNPNHRVEYAYSGEGQQTLRRDVSTAGGTKQTLRTAESIYNSDNTKRAEVITTTDARTPAAERVLATCNTRADGTSGYDSTGNLLHTRTIRGPDRTDGCALTDGAVVLREQTMTYDDRDWLTTSTMRVRSPQTGAMISRQQRMTYHPNGSKASVTHDEDADTTQQYKADYAITPAGWEASVTDWRNRTSELTYLPNGSVTRQVLGKGGAQPTGVATANSTYKVDGTLASLAWTTGGVDNTTATTVRAHTDIRYDNRGLRVAEDVSVRQPGKTSNDAGVAGYSYDLLDRLTRYTSPHPYDDDETRRATTSYTLDDGGNTLRELTTVRDADGSNVRTLGDITNTYDNGRLTRRVAKQTIADAASQLDLVTTDETFTYNDLGEETKRTGTDKYAGTDLPVPLADTTSTTDTRFDAAGHNSQVANTATKPVGTPQSDVDKANADVDYDYDTTDRVISRRETKGSGTTAVTTTTLYFYAGTGGSLIEETDGTGKTKTRYLLDGDGESIAQQTYKTTTEGTTGGISSETGEKWSWLLNDALGNTATTLDDTGKVIEQKAFDPFGKPENGASKKDTDTDAPTTTLGFQSARTDEATGRVMLGQRQYDPTTARFTTPDTYVSGMLDVGLGTDSLTGNRYLFAGANPLAFYEDGHGMFSRLKKIAKAAVPALQFVPIVSTAIDVASAATGRNFYNGGRKMTGAQRLMMLGGAALSVVPGVGAAAKAGLAVAKNVQKGRQKAKILAAVDKNQDLSGGGTYLFVQKGKVVRTGMTNDFARRQAEHARAGLSQQKGFEFYIVHRVADGPNAKATRLGLERKLYDDHFKTAHKSNGGLNKATPYRASNRNAPAYDRARQEYLARKWGDA